MKKKYILWSVIGVLALLIFQPFRLNNAPSLEEGVKGAWGQVENVYQRRSDLVPNLVETVKAYAGHENTTLREVIEARAKATQMTLPKDALSNPQVIQQFQANQDALTSALSRLMVVVEKYPDLKANQNFMELQSQLEGTENRIAVERKKYVYWVQQYNTEVRTWPGMIYAKLIWGLRPIEQFTADAGANKAPKVSFK